MQKKPSNFLRFKINGKPFGQARHRARGFISGKRVIVTMYSPKENKIHRERCQIAIDKALEERGAEWDPSGPMCMTVVARYPCLNPLKTSKREQAWRAKKPDIDNIAKWLMDSMEGLVFLNDSQVVQLRAYKVIAHQDDYPACIVTVERLVDSVPLRSIM